ncbi:MAG: hypothetical protein EHM13_00275 [Acidobacteria bacterium]|nr:MAG: hypothetical protein EHM13_00275 [Acidobacteriota bacterium]
MKRTAAGKKLEARAVEIFGLTEDPREAGFILSDGTMLDLSGGRYGERGGVRFEDHTIISEAYYDENEKPIANHPKFDSSFDQVVWFQDKTGAIRFMPEYLAFYIRQEPTAAQEWTVQQIVGWSLHQKPPYYPIVEFQVPGRKHAKYEFPGDEPERVVAVIRSFFSRKMPNPWLAHGWVLPDGRYVPVVQRKDHKSVAASILRIHDKGKAFNRALRERWVRVGEATIQLPSPPDDSAFRRAVDHVRETSPADQDWEIRIEWWVGKQVVSYAVPILEFMELEGIGDLGRYPKAVW